MGFPSVIFFFVWGIGLGGFFLGQPRVIYPRIYMLLTHSLLAPDGEASQARRGQRSNTEMIKN